MLLKVIVLTDVTSMTTRRPILSKAMLIRFQGCIKVLIPPPLGGILSSLLGKNIKL